jgi:hypothetical protein
LFEGEIISNVKDLKNESKTDNMAAEKLKYKDAVEEIETISAALKGRA